MEKAAKRNTCPAADGFSARAEFDAQAAVGARAWTDEDVSSRVEFDEGFGRLVEYLDREVSAGRSSGSFGAICQSLDLPLREMDTEVYARLGVTGEALVKSYRHHLPLEFVISVNNY